VRISPGTKPPLRDSGTRHGPQTTRRPNLRTVGGGPKSCRNGPAKSEVIHVRTAALGHNRHPPSPFTTTKRRMYPLFRLRPRTAVPTHQHVAREPREVPREEYEQLCVEGDHHFAAATQDAVDHDPRGLVGPHAQPGGHRVLDLRVEAAAVVY